MGLRGLKHKQDKPSISFTKQDIERGKKKYDVMIASKKLELEKVEKDIKSLTEDYLKLCEGRSQDRVDEIEGHRKSVEEISSVYRQAQTDLESSREGKIRLDDEINERLDGLETSQLLYESKNNQYLSNKKSLDKDLDEYRTNNSKLDKDLKDFTIDRQKLTESLKKSEREERKLVGDSENASKKVNECKQLKERYLSMRIDADTTKKKYENNINSLNKEKELVLSQKDRLVKATEKGEAKERYYNKLIEDQEELSIELQLKSRSIELNKKHNFLKNEEIRILKLKRQVDSVKSEIKGV